MIYLENNVYLVDGADRAAMYDFNSQNLYHLNRDAKNLLHKILHTDEVPANRDEQEFLEDLRSRELITTECRKKHDILELYREPEIDFVWIEVTTGCNLQCIHCYSEASAANVSTMEYEDFCHVIDELVGFKITKIQIIGGEPFILGENLFRYLDYCVGKFEYLEIFTNGTLVSDVWMHYLKEHNVRMALSVYSYIDDEHNRITQNSNSFKATNQTIQKLHEFGIKYRVRNVLMDGITHGERNTDIYELSPNRDVVRMVGRGNFKLLNPELLKKKLITRDKFSGKLNKKLVSRIVSGHNCFSKRLYFSTDLDVYPCVMERRISHGNLRNRSLQSLIDPAIKRYNKDCIQTCKDCEFRYGCFDCRPDSLEGNVDAKPWFCTYDPHTGEWDDVDEFINKLYHS